MGLRPQNSYKFCHSNPFYAYVYRELISREQHVNSHYHAVYELIYIAEGVIRIQIKNTWHVAQAGDLVVYHPGVVHEKIFEKGYFHYICLRFERKIVEKEIVFPDENSLQPVFHLPWRERFHNLLTQIVIEHKGVDQWSMLLRGAYLIQFVALIWRALSTQSKDQTGPTDENSMRIGRIVDLIHSKTAEDITLKDLANHAFMSESRLSHVFKDVVGVSPKLYVIESKIEKAKELLSLTDKPVVEIARILGYGSPHYFSRIFKKKTGCTPGQYRKNSGKVQ
jgi:AraC-like DNA-binding protein